MRQCRACNKKLYKNYHRLVLLDQEFHLCDECGTVTFKPWPTETPLEGRLVALRRRQRGKGKSRTLTIHTTANPGRVLELRDLTIQNLPGLPPGLKDRARVLRVRTLYTPRPPRKKKKKASEEAPAAGEQAQAPAEPRPRFKKKVVGYSIYAHFG